MNKENKININKEGDLIKIRLNIGCGDNLLPEKEGWINMDLFSYKIHPNVVKYDITHKLPFDDCSVDEIKVSHILEHITAFQINFFIIESLRVLKDDGILNIIVPMTFPSYQHSIFMLPNYFYTLYRKDKISIHTSVEYKNVIQESSFRARSIKNKIDFKVMLSKIFIILKFLLVNEQNYVLEKNGEKGII